jgi:glycosyltransferase involved in cell wall biosynthesis
MKIAFYFNDIKTLNETGTFTAFNQTKEQFCSLFCNNIEFCCIVETEDKNKELINNVKTYILENEVKSLVSKYSRKFSRLRYRFGTYINRILKYFYIESSISSPNPSDEYHRYLNLKTSAFENIVKNKNIDLVVYNHFFYFPSLNVPYVLIAWDFAHRNIIGHLEFLHQFDWRERIFSEALDKAYKIITCNKAGKCELIRYGNVPEERIEIVPFSYPVAPASRFNGNFPTKIKHRFLFLPAAFWAHKNHITLLKAFRIIVHDYEIDDLQLVLAGPDKGNRKYIEEQIKKLGISNQVVILGFIERELIWELYRRAEMLVFPTLLGPNNLPPLEALSVGCPAVISGIEGHRQQFGETVLYFDPFDEKELVSKILKLLGNDELKLTLIEYANQLLSEHKPEHYLQRMLPIFEEFRVHRSTFKS